MKDMPKWTPQTVEVLRFFLTDPLMAHYGREIGKATGLKTGTLHPMLARLEQAGIIESYWEKPEQHEEAGRPRRRYYRFTKGGAELARDALADGARQGGVARVNLRPLFGHLGT